VACSTRTPALLALFILAAFPSGHAAAAEFDDLLAAVEKNYASRTDFSAQFVQTVVRAHLPDRPATKEGRFYFKKPGRMRFDYVKPDPVYYISDGTTFWNYIPDSSLAYKLKVEDSDLFYALKFLYGEGSLRKEFAVSDGGKERERRIVALKPTRPQHNFQQVRLFVDPASFAIVETEVTDPAGNVSRIVFSNVSSDPLPAEGFLFSPPDGVQVEDLNANPPASP
jgi:outer membrane lipoprotein carrier protein